MGLNLGHPNQPGMGGMQNGNPNAMNGGGMMMSDAECANCVFYEVEFKASRRGLFRADANRPYKAGDFVMVQADRGEDLGRLRRQLDPRKVNAEKVQRTVVRLATAAEVQDLARKAADEDEAIAACVAAVQERGLPLEIVGAEYQFDRNKLTYFYRSDARVDFRDLVKSLFRVYRVRIWMQKAER
jgi:cell fate regulator YaaT (PSP1 superfamily)